MKVTAWSLSLVLMTGIALSPLAQGDKSSDLKKQTKD
jgi:hypothetical protein